MFSFLQKIFQKWGEGIMSSQCYTSHTFSTEQDWEMKWLANKKIQICYYEIKFKKYSKIIEFMLNIRNFLCYSNIVMAMQVSPHWPLHPTLGLLGAGKLPELCLSCSHLRLRSQSRMQFPFEFFGFFCFFHDWFHVIWELQFRFPSPCFVRSDRDLALGITLFCSV